MKQKAIVSLFSILIFTSTAWAGSDFIYKSPNKIDYIKLDKAKKGEKEGGLKHPYTLDSGQIRSMLRSIRFNKKVLFTKDIENREVFDEKNVEFLAPYLTEAFQKAKDNQVVVVSYFTKNSKFMIQDDRLTVFRAFIKDDGLHIKFSKLYAKMMGDRTTMGAQRASSEARSMRVSLEPQPGQNRISWDPEELVFDLAFFMPGAKPVVSEKEEKKIKKEESAKVEEKAKSIRVRLKELDQLKKDEMITEKEYRKKRDELLREL